MDLQDPLLRRGQRGACPLCNETPCRGHVKGPAGPKPSPYRFPDRLRHTDADGVVHDPAQPQPVAAPPKKRRGKRRGDPGTRAKRGPAEDRAHHPAEDRHRGDHEGDR